MRRSPNTLRHRAIGFGLALGLGAAAASGTVASAESKGSQTTTTISSAQKELQLKAKAEGPITNKLAQASANEIAKRVLGLYEHSKKITDKRLEHDDSRHSTVTFERPVSNGYYDFNVTTGVDSQGHLDPKETVDVNVYSYFYKGGKAVNSFIFSLGQVGNGKDWGMAVDFNSQSPNANQMSSDYPPYLTGQNGDTLLVPSNLSDYAVNALGTITAANAGVGVTEVYK